MYILELKLALFNWIIVSTFKQEYFTIFTNVDTKGLRKNLNTPKDQGFMTSYRLVIPAKPQEPILSQIEACLILYIQ